MLPKIWKKLLLAICIIAILFNITSKLVNRISLEKTISSSPEGIDITELLNMNEEKSVTEKATTSHYNPVTEDVVQEQVSQEPTEEVMQEEIPQENKEETVNDTVEVQEENQESSNEGGITDITDITDFTTLLY